jgi:hypothetical protein
MNSPLHNHQPPATNHQPLLLLAFLLLLAPSLPADDARQIVAESQRRGRADSQRYEGSLEVINAKNKVSKKR